MADQTPEKRLKIAVLTSGGDSAGMNAAVRAVVKAGILRGCETYVVREGYEGLVRGNSVQVEREVPKLEGANIPADLEEDSLINNLRFGDGPMLREGEGDGSESENTLRGRYIVRVGWDDVRGWMGEGGTLIGTARSQTFRTREGRLSAAHNLIKEGIDALCVCGGDGSLTGADLFRAEWPTLVGDLLSKGDITEDQAKLYTHLRIVGLVGSIDNDMALTDMTIGAPTALHRICEAIDSINTTASSHSRAFVIEVMGRHCGWLALIAGVSAGADFVFIPEQPPEADSWEDEMCNVIEAHRKVGKRKTIVIVAEGAHDKHLKHIGVDAVKDVLRNRLGLDTRVTCLGHTQRGGRPCAIDRILPTLQGVAAVNALLKATPEKPSYVIGTTENKITRNPLVESVAKTKEAAAAIEAKDFEKAISLRDSEFKESYAAFKLVSAINPQPVERSKRLKIAILHVGAPAGGMNAATRTAVRFCLTRGHEPIAVNNGFKGLLNDNLSNLSWLRVDNWMTRGGSELGTNRTEPDVDLGAVAAKFQKHAFDGVLLIGGFEAFTSLLTLSKARGLYPAFNIPMVHLPATISNNVPLTEYSLGADTSLNALVEACDSIKQSASASRNRVFVVETQGGKCGYIATLGALATGAVSVYTPEVGITLDQLRTDVKFIKTRYSLDVKGKAEGRLIIRSEQASSIYTTEVITKILKEEGGSLFDSRSASLGHTLQGGIPSPTDRARAVRFTVRCMEFIEQESWKLKVLPEKGRKAPKESAAVITIQGSEIHMSPVGEVLEHADLQNRRAKSAWWHGMKDLAEELGGKKEIVQHML